MFFKKKMYDDEYEKAKIRGLKKRIGSETLIKERKKLEMKEKLLRKSNSPFVQFGKTISKKVGGPAKKGKKSNKSMGKNPLDDFFK